MPQDSAQTGPPTELFILYQMGASEEWTWFAAVAVFLSEAASRNYARARGISPELSVSEPDAKNEVLLTEPREFVLVRSQEGPVPEVVLSEIT